jgi:hypothetical protein
MLTLLYKTLDLLLAAFAGLRRVSVRVHLAAWAHTNERAFFVKVLNRSRTRDIEVTHAWVESVPILPLLTPDRPLPVRLKPDETWETWIALKDIPREMAPSEVMRLVRVQLSNGTIVRSLPNKNVPAVGYVAGGPITIEPPAKHIDAIARRHLHELHGVTRFVMDDYILMQRAVAAAITRDDLAVLDALGECRDLAFDELVERTGLSHTHLRRALRHLTRHDFLWRLESDDGDDVRYTVSRDGAGVLVLFGRA